jgi:hypothetical protein
MPRDTDHLIDQLTADLQPVRRLWPPALRALCWLALVAGLGVAMALRVDLPSIAHRLSAYPDMWLAVCGSVLTAIAAALACFQVSIPDRSRLWALLPLPGLLLWVGASGMGCLRDAIVPWMHPTTLGVAAEDCMPFILGVSLPLSVVLVLMLRRTRPLRLGLVAGLGGLATAAAAASLLWMIHPYDASAADLVMHTLAVVLVVVAVRGIGPRIWAAS